jgi:ribonuclease VapC
MLKSPDNSSPSMSARPANRAYVLDSFALFAYFDNEEGAELVTDLLDRAGEIRLNLSIINLGEFVYATERKHSPDEASRRLADLRRLPIVFRSASEKRVLAAARIKAKHPVSYADAFAIALAQELDATMVTGDPEFQSVEKIVDILWLREPPRKKEVRAEGKVLREQQAEYRAGRAGAKWKRGKTRVSRRAVANRPRDA